ncbi:MAG: response regulator [Siphonobacter sp.]
MKLKNWILPMLGGGILVEVLIGWNGYRTVQRLITTNNWINHTHVILQKAEQLDSYLTQIDNDLRGHRLSINPYFSADYNRNVQKLNDRTEDLTDFIKSADQKKRFVQFDTLLKHKILLGNALFTKLDFDGRLTRLDSVHSYLEMTDKLRSILSEIQYKEQNLMAARVSESEKTAQKATMSNIVGTVVSSIIILGAVFLLLRLLRSRTQLNRVLRENERRLNEILEAIPVSISVFDENGQVFFSNQASREMFKNEAHGIDNYLDHSPNLQVFRFPGGEPYPIDEWPNRKALQGISAQVADMVLRVNGERMLILNSARPIFGLDGELQYVVSSSVDISDRLESQERLEEAKAIAENAALMKENFLANMSHEIRTPLNAIIGFTNLLENTPLNAEQSEFMKAVSTASRNLLTIVNDILDISKIEAGMLQFESIPFSIASLVQSIKIMLQPAVFDKQLELQVVVDEHIPSLVLGDPTRLTQILLNLASNAVKFTEKGKIVVRVQALGQVTEKAWIQISVQDTGIGIASEVLPHIFERFRQESSFTTRRYGGSGLGLNIVHSLVEMQGGRISVSSTPGMGSLFVVQLPYTITTPVSTDENLQLPSYAHDIHRVISVLVVEDNPMNQKLALAVLGRMGYSAKIADNGLKALEKLQNRTYDLVLMDIQMPVMDGYETTRQIRNVLKINVPIIAMTAHALVGERERCLQVGMNDFISKPFQMAELFRIVRRHLNASTPVVPENSNVFNNNNKTPVFKLDYLREVTGGDEEAIADLLSVFVEETPIQLQNMIDALEQNDIVQVGKIAHALKSPAQMIGADEVGRILIRIQELAHKDTDLTNIQPLAEEVKMHLNIILPLIQETIKELLY